MGHVTKRRKYSRSDQRYVRACIAWEDAHGSVRDDYAADQWIRWCTWVHSLNAGLDTNRLAYVQWLVGTGVISDEP